MSIAVALKHMLAAGMPHDAIVAAVAEMEAAMPRKQTKGAARQQRYRERHNASPSTPVSRFNHELALRCRCRLTGPLHLEKYQQTAVENAEVRHTRDHAEALQPGTRNSRARSVGCMPHQSIRQDRAEVGDDAGVKLVLGHAAAFTFLALTAASLWRLL